MEFLESIPGKFNYWIYIVIMMIGLYAMISKNNLIKKLIGMSIFQTAIILFYVSIGVKDGATIPILHHDQAHATEHPYESVLHPSEVVDHHTEASSPTAINPDEFANPLPHVLMLTAIVVGVSTLGVGLAVTQKLYREFGSIEENEIIEKITSGQ
jgi:multicomponent Na+:H+ antiporter subunit C